MNKNVVIPIILGLIVMASYILIYQTPLSIGILILVILGIILFIQNKSNNDWGKMFVLGIISSIIIVGVFVLLIYLSNEIFWLRNILFWPNKGS
jgi:hypothetical protein